MTSRTQTVTDEPLRADDLDWWASLLAGAPEVVVLPADRARPRRPSGRRETVAVESRFQVEEHAMIAGLLLLLARSTDGDAVLGVDLDGSGLRPLRLEVQLAETWQDVAAETERRWATAVDHEPPDLAELAVLLGHADDPSHTPVVQVAVTRPGIDLTAAWDLVVRVPEGIGYGSVTWEYNADLFESATVARLAGQLATLLEDAIHRPDRPVGDLAISGDDERRQLEEWGDGGPPHADSSDRTLVSWFQKTAADHPDTVAVRDAWARTLTFTELDAASSRLARHLVALGVRAGQRVGVFLDRSCDLVVTLLAIQRAGAAYVPVDPDYPSERVRFVMADAGVSAVVTRTPFRPGLGDHAVPIVDLDADRSSIEAVSADDPGIVIAQEDAAYVIYTSGSTGRPKGVVVPHRAVVNTLATMAERPGLDAGEVMVGPTTPAFDLSVPDLFLPLLAGATLVLASPDTARDPLALAQLLDDVDADLMQATPATWRMLVESGWAGRPSLRIVCGGEGYGPELVAELVERVGEVWNFYGPTEAAVWAVCTRLEGAESPVPMGRPLSGVQCAIVDPRGHRTPIGVAGELWLAGEGLAHGYLDRPELTAERFVSDVFERGDRWYRTGDLVRYRIDGSLVFVGRADHQVKLRGFRVELGEIESALLAHDGVAEAVVIVREDRPGDPELVAYLVGREIDTDQLLGELRAALPSYMVPSATAVLDHLPLTPNGKLDRGSLPRPTSSVLVGEGRAASDHLEAELIALCSEVLGRDVLGVDNDLFDLGLTSIQAARLFTALEKRFHMRLPLSTMFEAPTVAGLAGLVRTAGTDSGSQWTALVQVRTAGPELPFFAVHGGAGTALLFEPLARRLAPDHPFYGLQAVGLYGREAPQRSIEEMAARYVAEMTAAQPAGPYAIGGYCFGGLVAWEMAHQLVSSGREVALVAMFNAPAANYNERYDPVFDREGPVHDAEGELVERIAATKSLDRSLRGSIARQMGGTDGMSLGRRVAAMVGAAVDRATGPLRGRLRRLKLDVVLRTGRPLPPGMREANVFQRLARVAQDAYVPPYLDVPVVVYRAEGLYYQWDLGWSAYTPRVVAVEIPGHQSIPRVTMAEPFVDVVATDLREHMAHCALGGMPRPTVRAGGGS